MKIFISADIEGTTGIVNWEETDLEKNASVYFRQQMTREVKAACDGALEFGADEILVKDAHDSARNIDPSKLPEKAKIFRGWARNPLIMMAGLDKSFDGVIFTGYHSAAGTNGNPLAHTMNTQNEYVRINGEFASEFIINSYTAAYFGVPVLFLSGDKQLCETAEKLNKHIKTVAVSEGIGNGSISINPDVAVAKIKNEIAQIKGDELSKYIIKLPQGFKIEIFFKEHYLAYKGSFYPGVTQTGPKTIEYEANDYMDVLKFLFFVL